MRHVTAGYGDVITSSATVVAAAWQNSTQPGSKSRDLPFS
jgi:hypothetical protein